MQEKKRLTRGSGMAGTCENQMACAVAYRPARKAIVLNMCDGSERGHVFISACLGGDKPSLHAAADRMLTVERGLMPSSSGQTVLFGATLRLGRLRLLLVLLSSLLASACSLPGYNSNPVKGDAWYDFGANETTYQSKLNKQPIEYDARIVNITPGLIDHQRRESAGQKLPAAERALTAPSENQTYKLGVGDVLRIITFGQPELNKPTNNTSTSNPAAGEVVDAQGDIYYPYVGDIQAAGKTPDQLRKAIASRLTSYIRNPQVDVRVMQYRSKRVYISGDIPKPCTVSLDDVTNTLLQALAECDTLSSGKSASSSAPASGIQNVVLIRNGKSTFMDLNQIYATGRTVPLYAGDRLLVDNSANRVFMMGEFSNQQALPFSTGGMSLSDAIADAGGISLDTANPGQVYVIRGFIDSQSVVDGQLRTILRPNVYKLDMSHVGGMLLANEFQLKPRDIVFVAPASLVNFNRALSQITPSLNVLLQSLLLYQRAGHY
jgi:polysaccharide export outer membrane protein